MIPFIYIIGALWIFAVGTVVGSFANVCVHRIPAEKSVIWPGSHCPKCLGPIRARDNVPVLGWLILGGSCRRCGLPISPRYPLIELLVGLLFVAVYVVDVAYAPIGMLNVTDFTRLAYHLVLVALLVVATFIDFDLYIIPDGVTVTGMVLGLALGTIAPGLRPEPASAASPTGGLVVGLLGLVVGGGIVWAIRIFGGLVFRREAMGFGDVTLLAMIGTFLGWRAAVLVFFFAPFLGLGHSLLRALKIAAKKLSGSKVRGSDHEIPYGPYLSLAALGVMLAWPWLWPGWARPLFATLADLGLLFQGL